MWEFILGILEFFWMAPITFVSVVYPFVEIFLFCCGMSVIFKWLNDYEFLRKHGPLHAIAAVLIVVFIWQGRNQYIYHDSPLAQCRDKLNELVGYYARDETAELFNELGTLETSVQPWDPDYNEDSFSE